MSFFTYKSCATYYVPKILLVTLRRLTKKHSTTDLHITININYVGAIILSLTYFAILYSLGKKINLFWCFEFGRVLIIFPLCYITFLRYVQLL